VVPATRASPDCDMSMVKGVIRASSVPRTQPLFFCVIVNLGCTICHEDNLEIVMPQFQDNVWTVMFKFRFIIIIFVNFLRRFNITEELKFLFCHFNEISGFPCFLDKGLSLLDDHSGSGRLRSKNITPPNFLETSIAFNNDDCVLGSSKVDELK
jgi:hypothetical protein